MNNDILIIVICVIYVVVGFVLFSSGSIKDFGIDNCGIKYVPIKRKWIRKIFRTRQPSIPAFYFYNLFVIFAYILYVPISIILYICSGYDGNVSDVLLTIATCWGLIDQCTIVSVTAYYQYRRNRHRKKVLEESGNAERERIRKENALKREAEKRRSFRRNRKEIKKAIKEIKEFNKNNKKKR